MLEGETLMSSETKLVNSIPEYRKKKLKKN
jgi:hypothetical protein